MGVLLQIVLLSTVVCSAAGRANRTCHGDIHKLTPHGQNTGATSANKYIQRANWIKGVEASNQDAHIDLSDLENYRSYFDAAADKYCIQAAVIAGIASRESRGGRLLKKTVGYGDYDKGKYNGYGIMQCDLYKSGLGCETCAWNSSCHIDMMVGKVLVPFIKQVQAKFPTWKKEQQLQGGVAAYNFGVTNVQTWKHLDKGTPHDDYSNDVIARAQYLQRNGWD